MLNLTEIFTKTSPKDLSDEEYWEVLKSINPEQAKEIHSFRDRVINQSPNLGAFLLAVGGVVRDPNLKEQHGDIDLAVIVDQGDPNVVNHYINEMLKASFPERKIEVGAYTETPSLLVQKPFNNNSFVTLQIYLADLDSTDRYFYYNRNRKKPVAVLGKF